MGAVLNYICLVAKWCFFFSAIYIPARLLLIKKEKNLHYEIGLWLFHLALLAVVSQTLTDSGSITSISFSLNNAYDRSLYSFVPFIIFKRVESIADPAARLSFALVNIAGNICIFMPVGFFARWAFRMKIWQATLIGAGLSVFVELVQIFLPRTADVDDVIMNTLGALLGALLWTLAVFIQKKIRREKKDG